MTKITQVSEQFSTAGQLSLEELQQLAQSKFKSVLNLRVPDEDTFLTDEEEQVKAANLAYAQVPLQPTVPNETLVHQALEHLQKLPQPVLIHCRSGARAGAIALIAVAQVENWSLQQITQKAQEIGLSLEQVHLQQFLQHFLTAKT